ncbi:MAG: trypsin-like peptidase domain-containing protein [Desulfofustis sp.]|nr:trypsin-like peptidase domain-containing protein [Desulfofustis sp.]
MKLCSNCSQALAESVKICPNCGSEVADGLTRVDTYRILEVIHEGRGSILYKAIDEAAEEPVALRLFTDDSGVDEAVAQRLSHELQVLGELPSEWFVQHFSIRCSADGRWYRVSEWVEAESWGSLLSSGRLQDIEIAYDLFQRLAAILSGLHQSGHFIPHLILNDILVLKGEPDRVDVKIDYKLSRFLDPKMARPGPMLQHLLDCHPDISGGRPLDYKSDIWSLGRIFAQILSANMDLCDPRPALKEENFPQDISVLIRSMLADDPDVRPGSMQEVADALNRLQEEREEAREIATPETAREVKRLRRTVTGFGILLTILLVIGGFYFFRFERSSGDIESALEDYANRYAGSVAFVMVQYRIRVDDIIVYSQVREGTAFLVDSAGYLLTNRHVACPWLEDDTLYNIIGQIRAVDKSPQFEYQLYMWFEGDNAFNQLVGIGAAEGLEDVYDLGSAYSRGGSKRISIAGVARPPSRTSQKIRAPLQDDFAVLKINRVPHGLEPLPLDREFNMEELERLSPVIALGFPLGSRIQADVINVSVTRGHIRRTFRNFFQVDTSIYKGNSGGPIIDRNGKVIGIASAVATDVAMAPMVVVTPLSDIGLVLPVTEAVVFIDELRRGRPKWNGVLDLSATERVSEIQDLALAGKWVEAQRRADQSLEGSNVPALIMGAAVMHYINGDLAGAATLTDRALSINHENYEAMLLKSLIESSGKLGWESTSLTQLMNLDWRSPGEFYGYLARLLTSGEFSEDDLESWNLPSEKSWLHFIAGLVSEGDGDTNRARSLFKSSVRAAGTEEWSRYLALAHLFRSGRDQHSERTGFIDELQELDEQRTERMSWLEPLITKFEAAATDPAERQNLLVQIHELQPESRRLLVYASYYSAMASDWPQSLKLADQYLQVPGREEPLRLGLQLLTTTVLLHSGEEDESRSRLTETCRETDTIWYRQVCESLLHQRSQEDLIENAGTIPEKIVTAHAALGFQAEAEGKAEDALSHYREALGSYLDTWIEFELARQRYIVLRQQNSN